MAVARLRDVGPITLDFADLGCAKSAVITLGSDILRAKCGAAISERYQGLTKLTLEAVVETYDPLVDIHPGDAGSLSISIPGAPSTSGLPDPTTGVTIDIFGILTSVTRSFSRNDLSTGKYTFHGISVDGITCPITITSGAAADDSGSAASFARDISSFSFASLGTDNFCMDKAEFTEASSLIEDSCQGQLWPTYVGITGLNVTATAEGKGVKAGFTAGTGVATCLGKKGRIDIGIAVGSDVDCASLVPGGIAHIERANVTSMVITATSGEIAKISLTWTANGVAGELSDPTKRAIVFIG